MSAKKNGGLTHVRYGHFSRPRVIEVVCPSCGALASASKPSEREFKSEVVGDLSPTNSLNDWEVVCTSCPKRISGLAYKDLPGLFYSAGELDTWAWNTEHMNCILLCLRRENTESNPYHWFMTYVHGKWKKNPDKAIRSFKKMHNN
ncbi:MAG: hypothetical protein K6L73_14570 [Cellvibrionaceae bacterium]